jgi:hypothetical protein
MAQQATININVNSKDAQSSVDKLSKSISNAGGSAASLKAELRQVTVELQGLEPGSKRFQELSTRAGELRDRIADTNAVITATAGNVTENFGRALGSAVQIGVAGFQGLMAAQTLFGVENEDLQKTLVQMGALLNLSQAIETFGGLGDKLVELKAGFTPVLQQLGLMATTQTEVAIATGAADAALVGEAVAADGAAVSTGFFATALNALPLVAIVTALGLLVGGLISYASASSNAEIQEKKRKKALEEEEKQIKKNNEVTKAHSDFISNEAGAFVQLALQIKGSNQGSIERAKLIKQINSEYGTTLKNLSDESLFQSQINLAIEDYLKLAEARYKLEQNETRVKKLLGEKVKLEEASNKFAKVGFEQSYDNFLRLGEITKQYGMTQTEVTLRLQDVKKELNNLTKSTFTLGNTVNTLSGNYDNNKGSVKDVKEETEKYADLLDEVQNRIERETAVLESNEKLRGDRLKGIDKEINSIEKLYGDERQSIIDRAIQREITLLDERFKKEGKSESDYLKASEEIRNNYGKFLLDSEAELLQNLEAYRQQDLTNLQETYTTKEQIVLETTKNIQTQTQLLQLQFEKNEAIRVIDESKKTEEEKQQAKLEVRKKYAQQEIDLLNKSLDEQKKLILLQLQEVLNDENKTQAEKEQAKADADQKIIQATQNTANQINEINAGVEFPLSDEDKLQKALDKINEYAAGVVQAFNSISDTISLINETRFANEERAIEGRYEFEKQALENQLAEGVIAREQYDNSIAEIDQQREQESLQLKKKEFDANKKLNLANAAINGAQAILQALGSVPFPASLVVAAIVAAASAVQFGIISSQEFTAAGGGIVPGMGSGLVDTVPARLAPGETVINTQSSQMYPELLNSINMAGGGVSLKPDLPATNKVNPDVKFFGDNKSDKPIRAYVVETDVSDTQKRINRIKQSSEF